MLPKIYLNLSKDGSLGSESLNRLKTVLKGLDGVYVLDVKEYKPTRSNEQNRYLHGVVFKLIADVTGYSIEEVKELMREMFLNDMKVLHGIEVPFNKSTTKLDKKEMSEFIEKIRDWASLELNCYIPSPNEVV